MAKVTAANIIQSVIESIIEAGCCVLQQIEPVLTDIAVTVDWR